MSVLDGVRPSPPDSRTFSHWHRNPVPPVTTCRSHLWSPLAGPRPMTGFVSRERDLTACSSMAAPPRPLPWCFGTRLRAPPWQFPRPRLRAPPWQLPPPPPWCFEALLCVCAGGLAVTPGAPRVSSAVAQTPSPVGSVLLLVFHVWVLCVLCATHVSSPSRQRTPAGPGLLGVCLGCLQEWVTMAQEWGDLVAAPLSPRPGQAPLRVTLCPVLF